MQKVHLMLGYAGLIPFIGLAGAMIYGVKDAEYLLLTYAALILSFLGGIVWMAAMSANKHWSLAIISNLVMLLAWTSLIFRDISWSLPLIAILMVGLQLLETRYLKDVYSREFLTMRRNLTLIASLSLFSAYLLS